MSFCFTEETTAAISPEAISSHVRSLGYTKTETYGEHSDVYVGTDKSEIILPRTKNISDYVNVMDKVLSIVLPQEREELQEAYYYALANYDRDLLLIHVSQEISNQDRTIKIGKSSTTSFSDMYGYMQDFHFMLSKACFDRSNLLNDMYNLKIVDINGFGVLAFSRPIPENSSPISHFDKNMPNARVVSDRLEYALNHIDACLAEHSEKTICHEDHIEQRQQNEVEYNSNVPLLLTNLIGEVADFVSSKHVYFSQLTIKIFPAITLPSLMEYPLHCYNQENMKSFSNIANKFKRA